MKLTSISLFILLLTYLGDTHAQDTIFFDDFENGNANNWEYENGWEVIQKGSNYIFEGQGHVGSGPVSATSANMRVEAKIQILSNGLHFNFGFPGGRYLVAILENEVQLHDVPFGFVESVEYEIGLNKWHKYIGILSDSTFHFCVDDSVILKYNDSNRIGWKASIGFECLDHIYIDTVVITSKQTGTEKNSNGWIRTGGPWGGIGYDVRIDPSNSERIYVTDQWAGNHKSIDGGKNWYPNNNGIGSSFGSTGQSIPIFSLTIDPSNTNNMWCGTFHKRGVYQSTDYGENWHLKTNGIPEFDCGITFRGFAIRPDNPNIVFCGAEIECCPEDIPFGKVSESTGKIFKTIDGGENWFEVLNSDALIRHILINPIHPDTMYASTGIFDRDCLQEEGIWKSTDGGENWFHVNNGLTDLTVGGLDMDSMNPEVLWACTGRESGFGGDFTGEIFKTVNGGQEWVKVYPMHSSDIQLGTINSIAVSKTNKNKIVAATSNHIIVSNDFGSSWDVRTIGITGVATGIPVGIAIHPDNDDIIYTNSYSGGVFYTDDDGDTWQNGSKGYTGAEMLDLIIDPDSANRLISIGRAGIAKSYNAGYTWIGAGNCIKGGEGVATGPMEELTILEKNPKNKKSLLASAFWSRHLLKTNNWMDWEPIYDFKDKGVLEKHGVGDISYAAADSNIIYLGIRHITLPLIMDRPQHYDPTIISYGMLLSEDSGNNWKFINNGLEETTMNIQTIKSHPINKDIAYIGVYGYGIYKTENGGQTWEQINEGLTSYLIADISICHANPNVIYAGAEDGGIFKTIDGGENWIPVMNGMDPEASVRSIVFHPGSTDTTYAADWHSGTYVTYNGGDSWYPLNAGLSQRSIQKLAIAEDASIIYAATQGGGVFRLPLVEFPPMVESLSHDSLSLITLQKGDSITLSVDAYDVNDDSLSYSWSISNLLDLENSLPSFTFYTDTLNVGDYEIELTISDTSSNVKVRWVVTIVEETINQITINESQNSIRVFPNPIEENKLYFQYEMSEELLSYQVYDINGQLLANSKYVNYNWIEFSNYNKGIYILKFIFESKTEIHKVIKL